MGTIRNKMTIVHHYDREELLRVQRMQLRTLEKS